MSNRLSPELRAAVDAERRYTRLTWPWSAWWDPLIAWLCRRCDRMNPPWGRGHFADWSAEELIDRIEFLQGAGRRAWIEKETWRLFVAPLAVVAAFAAGMWFARW